MTSLTRRRDGRPARVGFVELFFDLVFVFAVTQISHTLLAHLTPLGALQAAMMAAAVWWAWIYTSWVTNWLDPERAAVRIALFAVMGAGLLLSTSLPEAFGAKGLWFALAFVSIQVGRSLFMLWAVRKDPVLSRNFLRILCWSSLSGLFWIAGGLVEGQTRLWLWLAALAIEYVSPALSFRVPGLGKAVTADWTVEGGHIAERVGLFVIICLGESILVTGATFADLTWTSEVVAAAVVAFVGTLAMWWLYFSASHEAASEVIANADDPGKLARRAYTYCPILIVAGIIVTAVGDELALMHPTGPVAIETAAVLIGGPLLFMIGGLLAQLAVFERWAMPRVIGVVALAGLWFVVPMTTPLGLAALTTAVMVAVAAWETLVVRTRPIAHP
ncbi:low temperature requirement protein A [Brevundimonas sp.]|uniref:low temperature requirement protein A n=1 Tax=Brevundimonas sp. TaxID=1871086 RepID=UPI00260EE72E|nr:low temperature requirement protein A [Brevundimonas sp.]